MLMLSLTNQNRDELDEVLSRLDLAHVEFYVTKHNPSVNIPYHNLYHAQTVALTCSRAAHFASLPSSETKALIIAALFHDFGHSGGKLTDAENIHTAIDALRLAWDKLSLDHALLSTSLEIISATQYPYVIDAKSEAQRIIRDADLCQVLYEGWDVMLDGLKREMDVSSGHTANTTEFTEKAFRFWRESVFLSKWGQATRADYLRTVNERQTLAMLKRI
jgi:hypothetical protein